ncbi:MAG: lysine--tRNA ligase [Termitinemataceae bacterium]|nr:MAG: lysine--tRNA ligase [Termitinemataceae bacterium]
MAKANHWADETAAKIVREKGEKALYTCASGITPSGTVHIGNFREIISVDLVVRALRSMGKTVRFIYSWDDYDVFRKVPVNMPKPEELENFLRFPITMVPDPWERDSSYARHHEVDVETMLPLVGIEPEFLYQTERYRASRYAEGIKKALEKKAELKVILDKFRDEDHKIQGEWWPISVFCEKCSRDDTEIMGWDGEWLVEYKCNLCGHTEKVDLRSTKGVKLVWRVDWPMRWAQEQVDFEPAGKDHHSQGGSFDTSRLVCKEVYGYDAPVTFRYDFIGIKGLGGKMSSSKGKVVDLETLLSVYTPEIARYLFAGTRPNTEFTISFDLDVIKIYEDYDKTERIAFKQEAAKNDETYQKERRIWELSQVGALPQGISYQVPFRHLCNLLQIADGDIDKTIAAFTDIKDYQIPLLKARCICALNWINDHAPQEFCFKLRASAEGTPLNDLELNAVRTLRDDVVTKLDSFTDDKSCSGALYGVAEKCGIDPKELFRAAYQALIEKDQGPRLASFLRTVGKERLLKILTPL